MIIRRHPSKFFPDCSKSSGKKAFASCRWVNSSVDVDERANWNRNYLCQRGSSETSQSNESRSFWATAPP